jgi:acyl carrier protein
MVEMFHLDPKNVTLEARLVEDLDLDSIDAIDMAVKIQEFTGKRLEEEELRRIHTVADVVHVIDGMLKAKAGQSG